MLLKTYSRKHPLTVTVKRRRWLRGKDTTRGGSYLLRESDKKQCCLGFACRAIGVKRADILGRVEPCHVNTPLHGLSPKGREGDNTWVAGELMGVNDDLSMGEAKRERKIAVLGKRIGLKFVFAD